MPVLVTGLYASSAEIDVDEIARSSKDSIAGDGFILIETDLCTG